jgi:phosphoribosyl-dephospho-CoA transferase
VVQKQEALTSVTFERVNLGKVKKSTNSQQVKDASIALLKQKYKNNELEVMDYLMKISAFVKNYN